MTREEALLIVIEQTNSTELLEILNNKDAALDVRIAADRELTARGY
jgi:hypothetical protein